MTQDPQIIRTAAGSIDMSYYQGKGLDSRSRAARRHVAWISATARKFIGRDGSLRHLGSGGRPNSASIKAA